MCELTFLAAYGNARSHFNVTDAPGMWNGGSDRNYVVSKSGNKKVVKRFYIVVRVSMCCSA